MTELPNKSLLRPNEEVVSVLFRRKANRCEVFELIHTLNNTSGRFCKFDPSPFREPEDDVLIIDFIELEAISQ